jgi:hypothetical protein
MRKDNLIILELQLVHHFIEGTNIDKIDINTILALLVLVLPNCSTPLCYCIVFLKVKVKVTLRLMVSQSVCLGVEPKYGTFDQRFFF